MAQVDVTAVPIVTTSLLRAGLPVGIEAAPIVTTSLIGATVDPYVYVVDSGNNRVNAYDYDGVLQFSFGTFGSGNGQFNNPYGIASNGTYLFITDRGNNRVQVFTMLGVYVAQFGSGGTGDGEFDAPMGIAVDSRFIWVVDNGNNRFQIFFIGTYLFAGKVGEFGAGENQFNGPTDCAVDSLFFYIDDAGNSRTVIYPKVWDFPMYGAVSIPAMTLDVSATIQSNNSHGAVTTAALRMQSAGATMETSRAAQGSAGLPALTMGASGAMTTSHAMHGDAVLPALTVSASAGTTRSMTGAVELPALTISGGMLRIAVMSGDAVLPALIVAATGYTTRATPANYGMAVNMRNKAITKYDDFNFNSFAVLNGKLYGAASTGIHLLEGDDDNGTAIAALIRTGRFDLHDGQVRKLVDGWISGRFPGQAIFSIHETEGDDNDITEYPVVGEDSTLHDERIGSGSFAKGHDARFVEFGFANVEGSDFDITGLAIRTHDVPRAR